MKSDAGPVVVEVLLPCELGHRNPVVLNARQGEKQGNRPGSEMVAKMDGHLARSCRVQYGALDRCVGVVVEVGH